MVKKGNALLAFKQTTNSKTEINFIRANSQWFCPAFLTSLFQLNYYQANLVMIPASTLQLLWILTYKRMKTVNVNAFLKFVQVRQRKFRWYPQILSPNGGTKMISEVLKITSRPQERTNAMIYSLYQMFFFLLKTAAQLSDFLPCVC